MRIIYKDTPNSILLERLGQLDQIVFKRVEYSVLCNRRNSRGELNV